MKIQLVQKDVSERSLTSFVLMARKAGVDLVCFPELATSGCLYEAPDQFDGVEYDQRFDVGPDGPAIMAGVPTETNGRLFNTYRFQFGGRAARISQDQPVSAVQ